MVTIHFLFDGIFTGPFYDKEDLIENYELKSKEIFEVKQYFESILPKNAIVHIEFENDSELAIFHVKANNPFESNWRLKILSSKTDSLLNDLNWTVQDLRILKDKLDKANCISISSRKPVSIGWKRSGMGMFSYTIFDDALTKKEMKEYDDKCSYIYYKENIVLEYGGGAIGRQCFPEWYETQNLKAADNK